MTVAVGPLTDNEIYWAMAAGLSLATAMYEDKQIAAVYASPRTQFYDWPVLADQIKQLL